MQELNQAKKEAFAGKMVTILNGATLALMISIGRQTGLLETMARLPPSTSEGIAKATGLNERYLREWLVAMVTGGIVEFEAKEQTYLLPPEHASSITNAAGPNNIARFAQFVPMLALVEADIIECFRNGGGVPYAKFPGSQALMAESSALRFEILLLEKMVPLTGMGDALARGIEVLDVGCGQGHVVNLLAQAFRRSRFTGYDFSETGITSANAEAQAMGNTNVRFEVRDVAVIDELSRYNLIMALDAIHDQARPADVLRAVADALTPEGTFLMVDVRASSNLEDNIDEPFAPYLYGCSTMHCMTVSLALDGAGLGAAWGEQKALEMLEEAGFKRVDVNLLEEEPMNNFYVARKV